LRAPEIELVRGPDGTWNVASLGSREASTPRSDDALVLNRLLITGGRVAVTDLRTIRNTGGPDGNVRRSVYDGIDLQIDDFGPGRAFDVSLRATLPGENEGRLTIAGTAGPLARGALATTPFQGTAQLEQISVGGALRFLDYAAADGTDAVMSGSARLGNERGRMSAKGEVHLEETRVRGVAIGYPIAADFDLSHDSQSEILTIGTGTLRLNKTPISMTGTIDLSSDSPLLDVHVSAADASLAEAARLASAFGAAFGAGTEVSGNAAVDVRARGPARTPALEGKVNLRSVSISGKGIARPVRTPAIDISLTPDAIRSNDFSVTTAGTSVGVQAALSQYTTATPLVDARIRTANAEVGEILNAARAWGVAPEGTTGTGRMNLDVRAIGPVDALAYTGSGRLENATIKAPSIAEPVRITNASLRFNRDAAVLDKLAGGIATTNVTGRLAIRRFTAPNVDFELAADRIDVQELQRVLSPGLEPQREPAQGRTPAEQGILARTTGTGRLRVGSIVYDKLIVDNAQTTVRLDKGLVRMDPLTAGLFDGRHRGSVVMDARRTPAVFNVSSSLEKVDANKLTSAVTSLKNVVYGAANLTARMTFAGDRADELARSMNGTVSFNLDEGRIATLSLRQEIANIARLVSGVPKTERSTQVAKLNGDFEVKNGLARTDNLTASIEGGSLAATGTIDLADQSVDLRLVTMLSSELSQRAGDSRVGGILTTVLTNERGELLVPLIIGGTMSAPRVSPDPQRVAEMKLKGATGIRDILGAITGRTSKSPTSPESSEQAPPPQPEATKPQEKDTVEQVQDALRDLFRRRKPEQKPAEPQQPPPK
jgi:uncharacterized protein involved in outer membrane biogenesis